MRGVKRGWPTWKAGAGASGPDLCTRPVIQAVRRASMENSTTPARTSSMKHVCTSSHLLRDAVLGWACNTVVGLAASSGKVSDPCRLGRWIRPGEADMAVLLPEEEGDASITGGRK